MSGTGLGARVPCHGAGRVLAPRRPDWLPLTHSNTSTRCSGPTRGPPSKAPTTGEQRCRRTRTHPASAGPAPAQGCGLVPAAREVPKAVRNVSHGLRGCKWAIASLHTAGVALEATPKSAARQYLALWSRAMVPRAGDRLQGWCARCWTRDSPATTCLHSQGLVQVSAGCGLGDGVACPPCNTGSGCRGRGELSFPLHLSPSLHQFGPADAYKRPHHRHVHAVQLVLPSSCEEPCAPPATQCTLLFLTTQLGRGTGKDHSHLPALPGVPRTAPVLSPTVAPLQSQAALQRSGQ